MSYHIVNTQHIAGNIHKFCVLKYCCHI